MLKGAQ